MKDLDGFDLQISNGNKKNRRTTPANGKLAMAAPFEINRLEDNLARPFFVPARRTTKRARRSTPICSAGRLTYDEGSQNECMIGDVGDIIIRGGNPLTAAGSGGRAGAWRRPRGCTGIDHISFGISPWDTDKVKADLEASARLRGAAGYID